MGSIEVITGPMFSGKSEELIRRVRRAQIARLDIHVFKHEADDRYSAEHVVSHSEWRFPSRVIKSSEEILPALEQAGQGAASGPHHSAVVAVDEVHFFDDGIVSVARSIADRGLRVILAGLDLDYLGQPFGPMPQLLAIAEDVTKLNAICIQCGEPAHFSQRLVPSGEQVLVGAHESYEARCRRCFVPGPSESRGARASRASHSASRRMLPSEENV
jgi:thymidine kinase